MHATPGALALLARHCGSSGSALPEQVRAWLTDVRDAGTQKPLVVETDGGTLVVRTVGEFLLLEGRPRDERLTRRERQIMELVAAGKTNAKIATILCLAPGTVRRHLQNVYAKLGVHNRTSAVAWLRASSRGTSLPAATPGESSGL